MKRIFRVPLTTVVESDVDSDVGRIRIEDGKMYRFVQNAEATTALTVGQAAFHKLSDTSTMENKVYVCLTANLSVFAGIVCATSLTAQYYGWVQIYGYCASVSVSGATTGGTEIAIGDWLKGVTAVGHMVRDAAYTTHPTYPRAVMILEAVATTTTPAAAQVKGFVHAN